MLSIISMNRAGLSDGCLSVKVDFEFDNASTLPERVITVSGMSYIIAKDSTAKNTVTNVNYKYTGSKWVKVTETVEPVTSGTITDNGDYTITSNEYTGLSDISVDVNSSSTSFTKETMRLASKIPNHATMPSGTVYTSNLVILDSINGEYDVNDYGYGNIYFVTPVKKVINAQADNGSFLGFTFTPSEDFDGIYNKSNQKYTLTGNALSADGKTYFMDFEETTKPKVTKYSAWDFTFTIE